MTKTVLDAAIIGGGIAGVSIAAIAARNGVKAALFEMESSLAYHTTGRSAALFTPNYGPQSIRALAKVARPFLENPPPEAAGPLLSRRGLLEIVPKDHPETVVPPEGSVWLDCAECLELVPILKADAIAGAIHDPSVASIDVHALHGAYVKIFRGAGGAIHSGCQVTRLNYANGVWHIAAGDSEFAAKALINASGAWSDTVAQMAGIRPVGLVPRRRTAALIDQSQIGAFDFDSWPMVATVVDYMYFQPFGKGRIMISPEDETPSAPCDAQPEELDIAVGISRFEEMTTAAIRRVEHSWAGLRTFAPDRNPVIGWDPDHNGFFWVAGQGGYGIFTSPAIGRYGADLFCGNQAAPQYAATGYDFTTLSPQRFRQSG